MIDSAACNSCHAPLVEGARFCMQCGAGVGPGAASATTAVRPFIGTPGVRQSGHETCIVMEPGMAAEEDAVIRVLPQGRVLSLGQVASLSVAHTGDHESSVPVQWESEDPAILRVGMDGQVTALRPGTGAIRATRGTRMTEAVFTVTRVEVTEVRLTPGAVTVSVGDELHLTVVAGDRLGSVLHKRVISWSSTRPQIADVRPDGTVVTRTTGSTIIRASLGAAWAEMSLKVTPAIVAAVHIEPAHIALAPGESLELVAHAVNPRGRPLPGLLSDWLSSDPSIASISAEGLVTGLRAGSARVAATVSGRRTTAVVTVRAHSPRR
ncbi:MAG: Ig-like domain-containing protein [Gemmatimonadota bacterium]